MIDELPRIIQTFSINRVIFSADTEYLINEVKRLRVIADAAQHYTDSLYCTTPSEVRRLFGVLEKALYKKGGG